MTRCALYRHFDTQGLQYVGISADPTRRMYEHKCRSEWAKETTRTEIEWHPSRDSARQAETRAIASEGPRHNSTGCEAQLLAHLASLEPVERGEGLSFGVWLKERGITQSAAAVALDQSRSYICEVCNGTKSPSLRLAVLIEDFTGGEVTVRDLADFYDHTSAAPTSRAEA